MKAIGRPETGSGDQVKAEIDQFADTTKSSVDAIKTEAESLQDEGVVAFAAGAASIAGELDTIVQTGKTTLSDIEQSMRAVSSRRRSRTTRPARA